MDNISTPSSPDFSRVFSRAQQFDMNPEERDILTDQLARLKEYYKNPEMRVNLQAEYERGIYRNELKGNAEFMLVQGMPIETLEDLRIWQSFMRATRSHFKFPEFQALQDFFQSQSDKKLFLNLDYENMERVLISQEDSTTHSTGIAYFSLSDGNIVPLPESERISFVHGWDRVERYEPEYTQTAE